MNRYTNVLSQLSNRTVNQLVKGYCQKYKVDGMLIVIKFLSNFNSTNTFHCMKGYTTQAHNYAYEYNYTIKLSPSLSVMVQRWLAFQNPLCSVPASCTAPV